MLSRVFTGLSLGFFFIALLIFTPFFYISIIFSLISLYGFYEWLNVSKEPIAMNIFLMIFLMILLLLYHTHSTVIIFAYLSLFVWLLILVDMYFESLFYKKLLSHAPSLIGLYMIISAWFMIISIGSTSSVAVGEQNKYLMFSLSNPDIKIYLISLLALVSLTDISGYFIGKNFGEKKLCKSISPNKTIAGLFGSILIPVLCFILICNYMLVIPLITSDVLFILLFCIFCTIGDLFISTFKRFYHVKDTGDILPGHGGILDRLDSYLPTISIFQIWLFL
jgi:phosphatidate cytidylyltransferase